MTLITIDAATHARQVSQLTSIKNAVIGILSAAADNAKNAAGERHINDIEIHTRGYVEPGCENPGNGIVLTGDWDECSWEGRVTESYGGITDELICQLLALGVELRWKQQWIACTACKRLLRINPHTQGWKPHYWYDKRSCKYVCHECLPHYMSGNCPSHYDDVFDLGDVVDAA